MKKTKTKAGLKIYDLQNNHIKTIPARYETVVHRLAFSGKSKRLSSADRLFLEAELIRDNLKNGNRQQQIIAERIECAAVEDCKKVNIRNEDKQRCELWFSNGERIICSHALFKLGSGEITNSLY